MTKLRMLVLVLLLAGFLAPLASSPVVKAQSCGACAQAAADVWRTAYDNCRNNGNAHNVCNSIACFVQELYVQNNCSECQGMIPTCN
jgi:hypothetical protein